MAAQETNSPVKYKESVEKKIRTSFQFYEAFKKQSFLSFDFEKDISDCNSVKTLSVMPDDVFKALIKFGLHSDLCHYSVEGFLNTYLPNLETGLQRDYGVAFPSEYRRIAHGVEERLEQKGLTMRLNMVEVELNLSCNLIFSTSLIICQKAGLTTII